MSHHIWKDRENTYVITGRLGARILAIRQAYTDRKLSISVDDYTTPKDIVFVQNIYDPDQLFIGFRVFICGKPVDVTNIAARDVAFTENPYVEPANILSGLSKLIGLESASDTIIEQELSIKMKYLKILEDNKLMDLVKLCYEQQQTIDNLKRSNKELKYEIEHIRYLIELNDH